MARKQKQKVCSLRSINKESIAAFKSFSKFFLGYPRKRNSYNMLYRMDTLEDIR